MFEQSRSSSSSDLASAAQAFSTSNRSHSPEPHGGPYTFSALMPPVQQADEAVQRAAQDLQRLSLRPTTARTNPDRIGLRFPVPEGMVVENTRRPGFRREGMNGHALPVPGAFFDRDGRHHPLEAAHSIPRPSLAEVPLECELCSLHGRMDAQNFVHVHSVEFQDCFTFGPRRQGPPYSWSCMCLDSAHRHLSRNGQLRVSRAVTKRQEELRQVILEAIKRAEDDEKEGKSLPWSRGLVTPYPPGPTWPQPPLPDEAYDCGRPPIWIGRSCPACSLADDFGSYVHVHAPSQGLCFTFGERGAHPLLKRGPAQFPLPVGEEAARQEREKRLNLENRIEVRVRHAMRRFYGGQNHLAMHRNDWGRQQREPRNWLEAKPVEGETAFRKADGAWRFRCCTETEDHGYASVFWYTS